MVFYQPTATIAHETIAFTAGECVRSAEEFTGGARGDGAYVCHLAIAAPTFELRAGGAAAAAIILPAGNPTGLPAGFVPEHSLPEFAKTIKGAEHVQPPEVIEQMYHLLYAASAASVPGQPALAHWKAVENLMRSAYYVDPKDGKSKPLNGHWSPGQRRLPAPDRAAHCWRHLRPLPRQRVQ